MDGRWEEFHNRHSLQSRCPSSFVMKQSNPRRWHYQRIRISNDPLNGKVAKLHGRRFCPSVNFQPHNDSTDLWRIMSGPNPFEHRNLSPGKQLRRRRRNDLAAGRRTRRRSARPREWVSARSLRCEWAKMATARASSSEMDGKGGRELRASSYVQWPPPQRLWPALGDAIALNMWEKWNQYGTALHCLGAKRKFTTEWERGCSGW